MTNFWIGFEKRAEEERPDQHHLRRFLLGNPISSAIEAKSGKGWSAFGHAYGHALTEQLKGMGIGGGIGAAAGALGGALHGKAGRGAHVGAYLGAMGGGLAGAIKGHHGEEASKIHGQYAK